MTGLLSALLALGAGVLALPALALLVLTLAAGRRPPGPVEAGSGAAGSAPGLPARPRVAVLVPAHNESRHVLPTIACLRPQLGPRDRLLVVADNCSDDTAALAREAGATVVERFDASLRGKGYALAFGVDALRADPPDVVFVIDADCVLSEGAIARVAPECAAAGRPVQMLNLMHAAPGAGVRHRVLEFAMVMKNLVRPLGSFRLGGACHLMGTGMALPWSLMSTARLATGHIAEDMKLGVELAVAGHPARFSLGGEVSSAFPDDSGTARTQKSRWEHGHLAILTEELPRVLGLAWRTRRPALAVMALDLMIPPLALYGLVLGAAVALSLLGAWLWPGLVPAAQVLLLGLAATVLAVGLGWWRYGRHLLRARELLSTPLYALWKLPVYVAYALQRRSGWVRTRRKDE